MLIENKNEPKINQCRWTHVLNEMVYNYHYYYNTARNARIYGIKKRKI